MTAAGRAAARSAAWLLRAAYRLGLCSFLTGSRVLALIPGAFGIHARRSWYRATLATCGEDLVVEWLTALKTPAARIGQRVFIGSMCWIAEADIRDDVMIGARAAIQGGGRTHGIDRTDVPMNRQPGSLVQVTIGPDVWIGTGAIVLADVATGSVVAAGAVVTATFEPYAVLAGVPAQVIRDRRAKSSADV